jgi:hypothetical protein
MAEMMSLDEDSSNVERKETTSVKEIVIKAWVDKITKRMAEKGSSVVEFFTDSDFSLGEVPWISGVLIPALKAHGMTGRVNYHGTTSSCDWCADDCSHSPSRKFIVSLIV